MNGKIDSTSNESAFKLKDYHRDFLNNTYFQVFTIMTPKLDWISIDLNNGDINKSIKQAKKAEISNLVVMDGKKAKGYINVNEWDNKEIVVDDWKNSFKPYREHLLEHSLPLLDAVKIMANDSIDMKRESSPLYFVINSSSQQDELIGIVTYWDLNRAPAYIISYAIQTYLEHTILLAIRDSHKFWEDHSEVLQSIKKYPRGVIRDFLENGDYNFEELSKLGFSEMLEFYRIDPHTDKKIINFPEDKIDYISNPDKYRNRVGHPVRLLVEDNDGFHKDIERLSVIWDIGSDAFLEFVNPKVRHSSPSAEERNKIIRKQEQK